MHFSKEAATAFLLSLYFSAACGDDDKDGPDSKACTEERQSIDAEAAALNFCEVDTDCVSSSINPHYGCYIHHNKAADTKPVLARIDAHSSSSCWNGMTTLTTLKCPGPGALPLVCGNKICAVPTLLTWP